MDPQIMALIQQMQQNGMQNYPGFSQLMTYLQNPQGPSSGQPPGGVGPAGGPYSGGQFDFGASPSQNPAQPQPMMALPSPVPGLPPVNPSGPYGQYPSSPSAVGSSGPYGPYGQYPSSPSAVGSSGPYMPSGGPGPAQQPPATYGTPGSPGNPIPMPLGQTQPQTPNWQALLGQLGGSSQSSNYARPSNPFMGVPRGTVQQSNPYMTNMGMKSAPWGTPGNPIPI